MLQPFARGELLSSSLFISRVAWLLLDTVLGRMITALLGTVCWDGPLVTRRVSRLASTPGPGPA
jgi:hypothetical protein